MINETGRYLFYGRLHWFKRCSLCNGRLEYGCLASSVNFVDGQEHVEVVQVVQRKVDRCVDCGMVFDSTLFVN